LAKISNVKKRKNVEKKRKKTFFTSMLRPELVDDM